MASEVVSAATTDRENTPGSTASSRSFAASCPNVSLGEGSSITRYVKYTHQLARWINAVRSKTPKQTNDEVVKFVTNLGIVPVYVSFTLDDSSNITHPEPSLHLALELYAHIAVTAASSTLEEIISCLEADNRMRQQALDSRGELLKRRLSFGDSWFTEPQLQLVVLHPKHFLPQGGGAPLVILKPESGTRKTYVVAQDGRLRESDDPQSPAMPPFYHRTGRLNVFFVVLNADIEFRRFFRSLSTTSQAPPEDVQELMRRTMYLAELIYWEPKLTPGSKGEKLMEARTAPLEEAGAFELGPAASCSSASSVEEEICPNVAFSRRQTYYGGVRWPGYESESEGKPDDLKTLDSAPLYSDREAVESWRASLPSDSGEDHSG